MVLLTRDPALQARLQASEARLQEKDARLQEKEARLQEIDAELVCPISCELMVDPVIAADGTSCATPPRALASQLHAHTHTCLPRTRTRTPACRAHAIAPPYERARLQVRAVRHRELASDARHLAPHRRAAGAQAARPQRARAWALPPLC